MKTKLTLVFSVLATAVSFADVGDNIESLRTLSGRTYQSVTIAQLNPDGVFFRHSAGAGKVLFSDLPSDVRQRFGYDSKKAEAYEKDLTARRDRERLACIARDKEIAKARASAAVAAAAQAKVTQAQYILAASQYAGSQGYGYDLGYPVVWGYGGGRGWYTERIPSPCYGGRAYYTVRRPLPGPRIGGQPFSAGRITTGAPYSPGHVGSAKFTNGVPALNASFVPAHSGPRHSGTIGTGTIRLAAPMHQGR